MVDQANHVLDRDATPPSTSSRSYTVAGLPNSSTPGKDDIHEQSQTKGLKDDFRIRFNPRDIDGYQAQDLNIPQFRPRFTQTGSEYRIFPVLLINNDFYHSFLDPLTRERRSDDEENRLVQEKRKVMGNIVFHETGLHGGGSRNSSETELRYFVRRVALAHSTLPWNVKMSGRKSKN